jgi:hypothetical protein
MPGALLPTPVALVGNCVCAQHSTAVAASPAAAGESCAGPEECKELSSQFQPNADPARPTGCLHIFSLLLLQDACTFCIRHRQALDPLALAAEHICNVMTYILSTAQAGTQSARLAIGGHFFSRKGSSRSLSSTCRHVSSCWQQEPCTHTPVVRTTSHNHHHHRLLTTPSGCVVQPSSQPV